MTAYGRRFERDGVRSGLHRVTARCLRLYIYQSGLLLLALGIVNCCSARDDVRLADLAPFPAACSTPSRAIVPG
jgi:hypothetical protein